MTTLNDGGPAFPTAPTSINTTHYGDGGMRLRDWFAGQIAAGMAAHSGTSGLSYSPYNISERSYEVADALIAMRSNLGLRPCTCHPDDNPPATCAHKYALTECRDTPLTPENSNDG